MLLVLAEALAAEPAATAAALPWRAPKVRAEWVEFIRIRPDLVAGGIDVGAAEDGASALVTSACGPLEGSAPASVVAALRVAESKARAGVAKLVSDRVTATQTTATAVDGATGRVTTALSMLTTERASGLLVGLEPIGTWRSMDGTSACTGYAVRLSDTEPR